MSSFQTPLTDPLLSLEMLGLKVTDVNKQGPAYLTPDKSPRPHPIYMGSEHALGPSSCPKDTLLMAGAEFGPILMLSLYSKVNMDVCHVFDQCVSSHQHVFIPTPMITQILFSPTLGRWI